MKLIVLLLLGAIIVSLGSGLFFLAKAILLVPGAIHAVRYREMIFGAETDLASVLPAFALGFSGVLTAVGVYLLAGLAFLTWPVGAAPGAAT